MTAPDDERALSRDFLTETVLAVPGVAGIFRAHAGATVVSLVEAAIVGQPSSPPLLEAVYDEETVTVTARIATDQAASTPDTARAVADVLLDRVGVDSSTVSVQVAHIHID